MFTLNTESPPDSHRRPWRRLVAALCTVALTGAGLLLSPIAANADALSDAVAAAELARSEANAADLLAIDAEAAAAQTAADALALRGLANDAEGLSNDAAAALLADPENQALIDAAAQALLDSQNADAVADQAELDAAAAAIAAQEARANADALEILAQEAEALAESLAVETEETESPPALSKTLTECDQVSFTNDNNECTPIPEIKIYIKSLCPTVIKVVIKHIEDSDKYEVWAGGEKIPLNVVDGKMVFEVNDVASGKFEVKVKYGYEQWVKDHVWVDKCPVIETTVKHECKYIDGEGLVKVSVKELKPWRDYVVTITGPNGYYEQFEIEDKSWWNEWLKLPPGSYTVSVESTNDYHKPHVGPVTAYFELAPCPANIVITINPVCATDGTGSLGANLSGLVIGREYHVTLTGPGGTITDVTFVATSGSWAVPQTDLPPGTYTVTVVDTHGYVGSGDKYSKEEPREEKVNLSWTATGTIADCPAVATLAATGIDPAFASVIGFLLLPIGVAALLGQGARRRRGTVVS